MFRLRYFSKIFRELLKFLTLLGGAKKTACGLRRSASLEVVRVFGDFGTFRSVLSRFCGYFCRVLEISIAVWRFLSRFGSF